MLMRPSSSTLWEAAPHLADQVGRGNAMVDVGHVDRLDAPVAELADIPADRDSLVARPGFFLDDEGGDPLVRPRRQGDQPGAFSVGDPRFRAVQHIFIPVPEGPAGDVAGIAAGVGLGQRQRASPLPARQ
jgi:hypothetical protein